METIKVNTGKFVLAFPKGDILEVVINSHCDSKQELELLLSDRETNKEAFQGERVCELWARISFGSITCSYSSVSGYLFAKV